MMQAIKKVGAEGGGGSYDEGYEAGKKDEYDAFWTNAGDTLRLYRELFGEYTNKVLKPSLVRLGEWDSLEATKPNWNISLT